MSPDRWQHLCCSRGWLRRLFGWMCEHREIKRASEKDKAHTASAVDDLRGRLNNVRLSMRTNIPLDEIDRLP